MNTKQQGKPAPKKITGEDYLESIGRELDALIGRVSHFIHHPPTVGTWRESILRTILRRHLPVTVGVGTGFVVRNDGKASTQIDILLYDTTRPLLFRDGDLVIVTPDVVRGLIEVKTTVNAGNGEDGIRNIVRKLADAVELIPIPATELQRTFFGVFSYRANAAVEQVVSEVLQNVADGKRERIINAMALGDLFIRFWERSPEPNSDKHEIWRKYRLEKKAPAFFIHNVIEHLCPESVLLNNRAWYSNYSKEAHHYPQNDTPLKLPN